MKHARVLAKALLKRREDGKVLLVRRSNTDTRRPLQWDFPGGAVEDDEDFVAAAARETMEEAGLRIEPESLHLAYTTCELGDKDFGNVCWLIFIGEIADAPVSLSFEHDQYKWVTLEEAITLITYDRQKQALEYIRDGGLFD